MTRRGTSVVLSSVCYAVVLTVSAITEPMPSMATKAQIRAMARYLTHSVDGLDVIVMIFSPVDEF